VLLACLISACSASIAQLLCADPVTNPALHFCYQQQFPLGTAVHFSTCSAAVPCWHCSSLLYLFSSSSLLALQFTSLLVQQQFPVGTAVHVCTWSAAVPCWHCSSLLYLFSSSSLLALQFTSVLVQQQFPVGTAVHFSTCSAAVPCWHCSSLLFQLDRPCCLLPCVVPNQMLGAACPTLPRGHPRCHPTHLVQAGAVLQYVQCRLRQYVWSVRLQYSISGVLCEVKKRVVVRDGVCPSVWHPVSVTKPPIGFS
jgi:hypothetical protein